MRRKPVTARKKMVHAYLDEKTEAALKEIVLDRVNGDKYGLVGYGAYSGVIKEAIIVLYKRETRKKRRRELKEAANNNK